MTATLDRVRRGDRIPSFPLTLRYDDREGYVCAYTAEGLIGACDEHGVETGYHLSANDRLAISAIRNDADPHQVSGYCPDALADRLEQALTEHFREQGLTVTGDHGELYAAQACDEDRDYFWDSEAVLCDDGAWFCGKRLAESRSRARQLFAVLDEMIEQGYYPDVLHQDDYSGELRPVDVVATLNAWGVDPAMVRERFRLQIAA